MTLLSLSHVGAHYGPSQALFDVSFEMSEGQALALLGRNGMGKSTSIRVACRVMPHSSGQVTFAGQDLARVASHRVARMGLGLVPEGRRCFAPLTVYENLIAAARGGPWDQSKVIELFPRLGERMDQTAGTLSGGEQQMLAIGRALMTNPRLLILDEATEGLAPLVRAEIWEALSILRRQTGLSLLIVDKSVPELSKVADDAVILERGRDVWSGPIADISEEMARQYLGL